MQSQCPRLSHVSYGQYHYAILVFVVVVDTVIVITITICHRPSPIILTISFSFSFLFTWVNTEHHAFVISPFVYVIHPDLSATSIKLKKSTTFMYDIPYHTILYKIKNRFFNAWY